MRITMNAFAASPEQSSSTDVSESAQRKYIWRDGDMLIARNLYAEFPPKCIICGQENHCSQLPCTIRKPPGAMLLFLPAAAAFTPYVKAKPYVCRIHRRTELRARWLGRALLTAAITLFVGPLIMLSGLERPPTWPVFGLALSLIHI